MTHAEIVAGLLARQVRRDTASLYADAFLEYQQAIAHIREHGAIIPHPKTARPIDNPYLAIRDRARVALQRMNLWQAAYLWEETPAAADPEATA